MPSTFSLHGIDIMECAPGKKLADERDAVDLIGEALHHGAELVLIPVDRLEDDFFRLRTRKTGEIVQKFVNYGLRLAIAGDISRYVKESDALRDFVYEANRGGQVWFVADLAELDERLSRGAPPRKS